MQPRRRIDDPQVGFWMVRLVKGGREVPACIQYESTTSEPGNPENLMERSPMLTARINGEIVDTGEVWERRGREISKAEYDAAPIIADPLTPIDLMHSALPF